MFETPDITVHGSKQGKDPLDAIWLRIRLRPKPTDSAFNSLSDFTQFRGKKETLYPKRPRNNQTLEGITAIELIRS